MTIGRANLHHLGTVRRPSDLSMRAIGARTRRTVISQAVGAMAAALAACGTGVGATAGRADDPLAGRTFLSVAVTDDGSDRALVRATRVRLSFEEGVLGASAGCNQMGGDYRIDARSLIVEEPLAMTEMGCDPERHEQDRWLAAFLTSGPRWSLEGDRLTLSSRGTVMTLQDRETADSDRPLFDTRWTLDGLIDAETVSSVPIGITSTLLLHRPDATSDELRVELDAGCNKGGGSAELFGAAIAFGPLLVTRMACPPEQTQLETQVLSVLSGKVRYEIQADVLTMTKGERGLTYRAAP
jgi:heat shock protein HslJ